MCDALVKKDGEAKPVHEAGEAVHRALRLV